LPISARTQASTRYEDLASSLSAAAHLIHGSSEGRFKVTYAPGPAISQADIEGVGYGYASLEAMLKKYDVEKMSLGWNKLPGGERVFFVPNPALGLWTTKERFNSL